MKMQNELRAPRDGTIDRVAWRRRGRRGRRPPPGDRVTRERVTKTREPRAPAPDPGARRLARQALARALQVRARATRALRDELGIEVADLYTAADIAGLDEERDLAGPAIPVHPRSQPTMYGSRAVDDAPVAGFATAAGRERTLPLPARAGPDRPLGRVRPADPDGLRQRRPRRPGGGPGRRADQLAGRLDLAPEFRSDSERVDDHRCRRSCSRCTSAAAERQGVPRSLGADPERHPQGVHRPAPTRPAGRTFVTDIFWIRARAPSGTRSASPATTCARPARRLPRTSRSTLADAIAYCDRLDINDFAGRLSFFFAAWKPAPSRANRNALDMHPMLRTTQSPQARADIESPHPEIQVPPEQLGDLAVLAMASSTSTSGNEGDDDATQPPRRARGSKLTDRTHTPGRRGQTRECGRARRGHDLQLGDLEHPRAYVPTRARLPCSQPHPATSEESLLRPSKPEPQPPSPT